MFFACHDPTTPGRQGDDIGPQYRSILVCSTEQQLSAALLAVDSLQLAQRYGGRPVLTEILTLSASSSTLTIAPSGDLTSPHRPASVSDNRDDRNLSDGTTSDPSVVRKTSLPLPHVGVPFYAASDYHQSYYARHANDSSYLSLVVQPKLERLSEDPSMRGLFDAGIDVGMQAE